MFWSRIKRDDESQQLNNHDFHPNLSPSINLRFLFFLQQQQQQNITNKIYIKCDKF